MRARCTVGSGFTSVAQQEVPQGLSRILVPDGRPSTPPGVRGLAVTSGVMPDPQHFQAIH